MFSYQFFSESGLKIQATSFFQYFPPNRRAVHIPISPEFLRPITSSHFSRRKYPRFLFLRVQRAQRVLILQHPLVPSSRTHTEPNASLPVEWTSKSVQLMMEMQYIRVTSLMSSPQFQTYFFSFFGRFNQIEAIMDWSLEINLQLLHDVGTSPNSTGKRSKLVLNELSAR